MSDENQNAAALLMKAVDLDNKKRYTEALTCYKDGLQILMNVIKDVDNAEEKQKLRIKIKNYIGRAEELKKHIEIQKNQGSYHEQIIIENDSCGHSYQSVFRRFLNESVSEIEVLDPYIRVYYQCQNFLRFCELIVKSCANLKFISLTTVENNTDQKKYLCQLQQELMGHFKIQLNINFSRTLHDREIRLNNGWIIKIGRGLDYFKGPEHKFSLGSHDLDLRKCHETTIDIFHTKDTVKSYG